MKKFLALTIAILLTFPLLASCSKEATKIAVIRNLVHDDHTTQFIEGAIEEGQKRGYIVDAFISNGDDAKTQELLNNAIDSKYSGIILSHGKEEYSYDLIKKAVDNGIEVVTFDTILTDKIEGVTETSQNDKQLAELSLGALIEGFDSPAKIVKIWYSGGLLPFDRRDIVYKEMEEAGLIETVAEIDPEDLTAPQEDVETALTKILDSGIIIDGIWGSWDEFSKGALNALNKADRRDIRLVSIDISESDRELMQQYNKIWTATAAVDAKMIGIENMKIMSKKLKNERTEPTLLFEGKLFTVEELS